MKKAFSSIVAALVAVSFAGIVCAAEPAKKEAAPAMPAGHPPVAAEKAPAKPAKKKKAAKKAEEKKDAAAPAAAPAVAPAAPAAPAKK